MNSARKLAAFALLPLMVAGCRHKNAPPLVQTQAPSIKTGDTGPPPSGNPLSSQGTPPLPNLPAQAENASAHAPKPAPKPRRRRKPKPVDSQIPDSNPATAAATGATPPAPSLPATSTAGPGAIAPPTGAPGAAPAADGTPAGAAPAPSIGLLSTGDVGSSAQTERDTVELITSTESGLNSIKRPLNTAEQETAIQIRSFLQKAKAAIDGHDMDAAHTLATKAKVLLEELTKS